MQIVKIYQIQVFYKITHKLSDIVKILKYFMRKLYFKLLIFISLLKKF